jgi:type II secretory pathway component PulF
MHSEAQSLTEICRWLCLWALPTLAIAIGAAWLVNLPAARLDRARFFLDALSLGLGVGHSPERAITEISNTRDVSLGARFHMLAAWIRRGLRLPDALDRMPGFLPAPMVGILRAGAEAGNLPGAIAVARRATTLPDAQLRAGLSCQIVILFILNPVILATLPFYITKVFPILGDILSGYGAKAPWGFAIVGNHATAIFIFQALSIASLYAAAVFYIGGNRFTRWLEAGIFPISAWLALRIPWKRKRLYRDFSTSLAMLLDAGLPEERALQMAADATANELFQQRASEAIAELKTGAAFTSALQTLDPPKEFAWRLTNALQRKGRFADAIEGWLVTLEAEATAQEQSAADILTTLLVIANGIIIAFVIGTVMEAVYSFSLHSIQ